MVGGGFAGGGTDDTVPRKNNEAEGLHTRS